jgi:ubiquinone/menaquinone biosynthesis C-methylase UbiE
MLLRKHSPEIEWARDLIARMWAGRVSRALQAASGVGLFARLAKGDATAETVAGDLALDAAMTEKLLTACAALDLVARCDRGWRLTPRAEATLVPGAPLYQGDALAHSAQVEPVWNDLAAHVRGREGWSRFVEGGDPPERSHRPFILAMHNMAMAGRAAELADRVADACGELSGHLMDVGGGPGTYAMALCERNPELQATVLDLPETVEIAREVVEKMGMTDRVRAVAGDWSEDEFLPPPADESGDEAALNDAVLMSNVLHGPESRARMKLTKARRSLRPGGTLIIQDFLLNDERTGPLKPALFNLMVGAFSRMELARRLASAGFAEMQHLPMPEDLGTSLLIAAKLA